MKVFLNCFLKKWQKHLITCTLLFSNSLQLDHINYLKLCKFLIMFMTLYMHLLVSTLQSALSAALYVACIASVSMGYKGKELLREKRKGSGRGRGRKETLADEPLDFENRPLCLSCLTVFMPDCFHAVITHSSHVCNPCARKIRNLGSLYVSV